MSLFKGPNGEISSKRVMAFLFFGASIAAMIIGNDTATLAFVGATTGLLGVQAVTKT